MIKYLKRNSDNVKAMISGLITLLGIICTIVSAVITFGSDGLPKTYIIVYIFIVAVSLVVLSILLYSNIKLKYKWNGLELLAERGHVYTIRMILMRDYLYKHNDDAILLSEINKGKGFNVKSAEFSFDISKCNNNLSDVHYRHKFTLRTEIKRNNAFKPCLFGENGAMPEECRVTISGNDGELIKDIPCFVKNFCVNYPVEENIYYVNVLLENVKKSSQVSFSYIRHNSYDWSKGGTFVIYPECYAKNIDKARFSCEFEDTMRGKLSISLTELFCNGRKPKGSIISTFIEKEGEGDKKKVVYTTDEIKINVDNIYIIRIETPERIKK